MPSPARLPPSAYGAMVWFTVRPAVIFFMLGIGLAVCTVSPRARAGDVVPLTEQHWRDAPVGLLEQESGIAGPVIEEWRRQERERNPYPSIPGAPIRDNEASPSSPRTAPRLGDYAQ